MKVPDIAIVGGGICGLTTALALEQRGITPTVYEAASKYRPVGAGLLLQTNALLVFDRLGVTDRIRAEGVPLKDGLIRSSNGQVLKRFDLDRVERTHFGYGFVVIHRADLQRILLDELSTEVVTGMECASVTDTATPSVRFTDGTTIRPDVLIGADGINSSVRDAIAPGTNLRGLSSIAYRSIAEIDLPERHRARGLEVWGKGTYTGGAPIADDRFYWFATAPDSSTEEPSSSRESMPAFLDGFSEVPDPIPAVIDSLDSAEIIVTDLEDVPPLKQWSRGSVVIAGDAAHGMLPFAGQGAAQSIEDALALAHAIDTHADPTAAFDAYEAKRKPRADRIRSESRWLGTLGTMQSRIGTRVRNVGLDLLPYPLYRRMRRRRASQTSLPESMAID